MSMETNLDRQDSNANIQLFYLPPELLLLPAAHSAAQTAYDDATNLAVGGQSSIGVRKTVSN